jgi:demethylmenaquinone methyltransferase/2-methoxy-6-polyprenyl-1,4-benzoquinol methylase
VSISLVDKREERIRRMFGAIAPTYDLLNHLLSLNIDRYWRWRTTRLVPPLGDGPILDLCTGTGDLAFAYHKAAKGRVPVTGSDFCAEMLDIARQKALRWGRHSCLPRQTGVSAPRIQFVQADAQDLPFASNQFQIVCVAFGLRNVTNTDRGIAEMVRVAAPGGRIAILEFSKPRGSVFGKLYQWYFKYLLPRVGQLISRSRDNAYHYLPQSVQEFPDGEALAEKLRTHGLVEVRYYPFTFGIATLYVGTKREGEAPAEPARLIWQHGSAGASPSSSPTHP